MAARFYIESLIMNLDLRNFLKKGDARSVVVKRNIVGSFFLKCISILISLQVVPLTINFVNPTQYGIWLTLSSIIAWLSYFDLGFAHGFRNRFAESKAKNDMELAKKYVSTTYAVLFIIFFTVLLIVLFVDNFINWSDILKIDIAYNEELKVVFGILACFFCMQIVAGVFTTMLVADQKSAYSSCIQTGGQFLAFICIWILTKTVDGSLTILAFAFSGIPCFLLIVVSIVVFHTKKYKDLKPSLGSVDFSLTKNILGLGGQFFIIMISMLFIFQFINIIISRIEGPVAVTQYNVAYKYYNVLNMIAVIILTPFWSAFTEAYVQKDTIWMKRMVKKLELLWLLCIPVLVLMVVFSNIFFKFWIGSSVHIPLSLSICMSIYVLFQTAGAVYMYMINGTSKVRLQMIVYICFAFISIPLISLFCKKYGLEGVLLVPSIIFFIQALIGKIQIRKLINGTASGIFNK